MEFLNTAKVIAVVTMGTFVATKDYSVFLGAIVAFIILGILYQQHPPSILEPFQTKINSTQLKNVISKDYIKPNLKNPLGNVLINEISDTPERKAAPPSFTGDTVVTTTKKMVQNLNKDINTSKELFGDSAERFELDQSLRQFYSTANTQVLNNQDAFANWLYGNMPSAKEGDKFALTQDNPRYNLH